MLFLFAKNRQILWNSCSCIIVYRIDLKYIIIINVRKRKKKKLNQILKIKILITLNNQASFYNGRL